MKCSHELGRIIKPNGKNPQAVCVNCGSWFEFIPTKDGKFLLLEL